MEGVPLEGSPGMGPLEGIPLCGPLEVVPWKMFLGGVRLRDPMGGLHGKPVERVPWKGPPGGFTSICSPGAGSLEGGHWRGPPSVGNLQEIP
jgi:hypothetical protein